MTIDELQRHVHTDLLAIAWIGLAIALIAFPWLRKKQVLSPSVSGAVKTEAFNIFDLLLIIFFFMTYKLAVWAGSQNAVPKEVDINVQNILLTAFIMLSVVGFLLFGLQLRPKVTIVKLFGLDQIPISRAFYYAFLVSLIVVPAVLTSGGIAQGFLTKYMGEVPKQPLPEAFQTDDRFGFRFVLGINAVVVAPLCEEIFYRGYLYPVVKRFTDPVFAAVFSSLLFALAHPGLISYAPLFFLAVLLVLAYEVTGSLLVPILMHAFFNLANLVMILFNVFSSSPG